MTTKFEKLAGMDVNERVETKQGLNYLSWSWAWDYFKRVYPDATYTVTRFDGVPYYYDENTGYLVMTEVTAEGMTLPMWLPVMDSKNKAMKKEPYEYRTSSGSKTVQAATMFDINTAIMRCLVKNLAMFGLGLYIYSGEDLPTETTEQAVENTLSLKEQIENCSSEEELSQIYQLNKSKIVANDSLLELVTLKGKKFRSKG